MQKLIAAIFGAAILYVMFWARSRRYHHIETKMAKDDINRWENEGGNHSPILNRNP